MPVIETSHLNQPHDESKCELHNGGVIQITDQYGNTVTLGALATLNLLDFLSSRRGSFTIYVPITHGQEENEL